MHNCNGIKSGLKFATDTGACKGKEESLPAHNGQVATPSTPGNVNNISTATKEDCSNLTSFTATRDGSILKLVCARSVKLPYTTVLR